MNSGLAASVRSQLLSIARSSRRSYNSLQLLYFQERFLARLSRSTFRDELVLKGGLYLYLRYGDLARPTQDMDFSGIPTSNTGINPIDVVNKIAAVDLSPEDAVYFDTRTLRTEMIHPAADNPGVRLRLEGTLGTAREVLWLDISFGNLIVPPPLELDFPTLLASERPRILASSAESVLAEKLHAATVLGVTNGRAKDFFDLFQASQRDTFQAHQLRLAFEATFRQRGTTLLEATCIFDPSFWADIGLQSSWTRFLANTQLAAPNEFGKVLAEIQAFLEPVLLDTAQGVWNPQGKCWVEA